MNKQNTVINFFNQLSSAARKPRPYNKKKIPERISISLDDERMELLNIISDRLGATRAGVAKLILEVAVYDAAIGCGLPLDENGNVPEEKKGDWDTTPKEMGFSFIPSEEEKNV